MAGKHQIYFNKNSFVSISTSFLKRVAYYFHASPKTINQSLLTYADLSLALPRTLPSSPSQSSLTPKLLNGDCVRVWFPQT